MDEINALEIVKEVAVANSKEVYKDGLKDTVCEASGALSTVVGLFNNVVLYPIKKANITYKYKLEQFEEDLKKKIDRIPEGKITEPPLAISGPTLEALKYTFDTAEIREMYLNLLSSAMNIDKLLYSHPAYVNIINQMSTLDANIFKIVSNKRQLKSATITFNISNTNDKYTFAMPKHFVMEVVELADPFIVSSSLENLERLGLITLHDVELLGKPYDEFNGHPYVQERFNLFKTFGKEIEIKIEKRAITINDFGENFAKVCL